MMRKSEISIMKAVAICHKPFLKAEEAMIYYNLGRTQLSKKCSESGVNKTSGGYYKKADLDRMMAGNSSVSMKLINKF